MVEYGVPHATFRVIGTVTDSDGEPVPGIRIATQVQTPEYIDPAIRKDTLYTDENGTYVREYMIYHDTENIPDSVTVTAEDIDRKANGGEFRSRPPRAGAAGTKAPGRPGPISSSGANKRKVP